jgi:hypothetical protein
MERLTKYDISFACLTLHVSVKATTAPRRPGPLVITTLKEVSSMAIEFKIVLPALPVGNPEGVAKRVLLLAVDGVALPMTEITDLTQTEVTGLIGPKNATAMATLTDEDDAGNQSEPRTATGILTDTFAPSQPGEFSIVGVREVPD